MREGSLAVVHRRRRILRSTGGRHDLPVAPNLLDWNFAAERPDAVWLADLSYIPTGEGWRYLAAVKGHGYPRDPPGPAARAGGQALAGAWPTTSARNSPTTRC
jgi:hypothetical protein